MKYRNDQEARAVAWAKRSYGRQFRKRMLQRLTPSPRPSIEKFRHRPFGVPDLNILMTLAAHWFRRNHIMTGRYP